MSDRWPVADCERCMDEREVPAFVGVFHAVLEWIPCPVCRPEPANLTLLQARGTVRR